MYEERVKGRRRCHFVKKTEKNGLRDCSPAEIEGDAGLERRRFFATDAEIKYFGDSCSRSDAVTKIGQHVKQKFAADPAVQGMQSCAEAGLAIAPDRYRDEEQQLEGVREERDAFVPLWREPGYERGPTSYLGLLGCLLIISGMLAGGYFEFHNARGMAMNLAMLNLGETYAEQLLNAGAMVIGLVVFCPAVLKIRELFLTVIERIHFRRRVFAVGVASVVLLVFNWGYLSFLNQSIITLPPLGAGGSAEEEMLKYAMSSFFVLQLLVFGIGMYGLTIALQRCWAYSFPWVVEESRVSKGGNRVARQKSSRQILWKRVEENCKAVKALLEGILQEAQLDAAVRVEAYIHHAQRKQIADDVRREEQDQGNPFRSRISPPNPADSSQNGEGQDFKNLGKCLLFFLFLWPSVASAEQLEIIYFVAKGSDAETRQQVSTDMQYRVGSCEPGTKINLVAMPEGNKVATLTVPFGSKNVRLRKPQLRPAWQAVGVWLKQDIKHASMQLNLPSMPYIVRGLRQTKFPLRLILVGSLVYDDPDYPEFKFDPFVPSDGLLRSEYFPFTGGVGDYPEGTKVRWLIPHSDTKLHRLRHAKLERFYRLHFQEQRAELMQITSEATNAFRFDLVGYQHKVVLRDAKTEMYDPTYVIEVKKRAAQKVIEKTVTPKPKPSQVLPIPKLLESPKEVAIVATPPQSTEISKQSSPPEPIVVEKQVVENLELATVQQPEPPPVVLSEGNVVYLRDLSKSMVYDPDRDLDVSWRNNLTISDMSDRIENGHFEQFVVIGFHGGENYAGEYQTQYWLSDGFARTPRWSSPTDSFRRAAIRAIGKWPCDGGTPMAEALSKAGRMKDVSTIYIYSDWELEDQLIDAVMQVAGELQEQGVTVHTVGFGRSHPLYVSAATNHRTRVAEAGGGKAIEL